MLFKTSTLAAGLKEVWERVKMEAGRPVSGQKPFIPSFFNALIHLLIQQIVSERVLSHRYRAWLWGRQR